MRTHEDKAPAESGHFDELFGACVADAKIPFTPPTLTPAWKTFFDQLGAKGLDDLDRQLLTLLLTRFKGPAGLETLAATVGEESDTLQDVYEPYLLQRGFLARTPRGRAATARAWEHLGLSRPVVDRGTTPNLFEAPGT